MNGPAQAGRGDGYSSTSPSFALLGLAAPRRAWLNFVSAMAVLGIFYADHLQDLIRVWSSDENYSHGFLVPLMSLYFIYEASRSRGPLCWPQAGGILLGISLMLISIFARLVTTIMPVGLIGGLGLIFGIAGLTALYGGAATLRRLAFPIGFLAFAIPLPVALYTAIASPLQLAVSRVASNILTLSGIPVLCEGNLITLPGGVQMFVAEACSGMRQLTGFLALTAAVAFLSRRPAWHRVTLILSSIPVAMVANIARVVLTGWIMDRLDPSYASGTLHTIEGLVMLGFGLALLSLEAWTLARISELIAAVGRESHASLPSTRICQEAAA